MATPPFVTLKKLPWLEEYIELKDGDICHAINAHWRPHTLEVITPDTICDGRISSLAESSIYRHIDYIRFNTLADATVTSARPPPLATPPLELTATSAQKCRISMISCTAAIDLYITHICLLSSTATQTGPCLAPLEANYLRHGTSLP